MHACMYVYAISALSAVRMHTRSCTRACMSMPSRRSLRCACIHAHARVHVCLCHLGALCGAHAYTLMHACMYVYAISALSAVRMHTRACTRACMSMPSRRSLRCACIHVHARVHVCLCHL